MQTGLREVSATHERVLHRELIDRPVVQIALAKPPEECVPEPESHHATPGDRWLDTEYQTALVLARLLNREFLGDAMPIAYPNLGPEVFSVFYGCPIEFGDFGTSWTLPNLHRLEPGRSAPAGLEQPLSQEAT